MNRSYSQAGRHMLEGTVRVFLAEALVLPMGFLTAAFLTRRLGPEGYGAFALATALVVWIELSITSLFSRATVKFIAEAEDWRPVGTTVMRLHLAVSGGAAFLLWLFAAPTAELFREPALGPYLRLFALDVPLFSLASTHRNLLVGLGRFRQRALASAGRWIVRLLLIIVLVEQGLSVAGAILGTIGASLVELIIGRFYVRPSLSCRSALASRKVWGYAVPLFLFMLSMRIYDRLDLFALKLLGATAAQAGIYGAAQNLSLVPRIFAGSLSPLLLSTLSRALHNGDSLLAKSISRNAMRTVIGLLPFASMAAGAASEIVNLVFGSVFLSAAPLLALLIFGALALTMISIAAAILVAAGKPRWTFILSAPLVPLAIVGHLLLIPRLGAIGASLVTTLFATLGALATVLAIYRIWRILPPASTLWRSAILSAVAYALAVLWPTPGLSLLLKLPVITLTIGLLFLLLGEFKAGEIALVWSMLRWRSVPE